MTCGSRNSDTPEELDAELLASFNVNVLGVVHSVNAFLPLLRKGMTKRIIVVSGEAGVPELVWKMRLGHAAAYGITKAAENMLATKYAALLEEEGFVVAAVSPGLVDVSQTSTEQAEIQKNMHLFQKILQEMFAAFPRAVSLTPEESARRLISFIDSAGPSQSGKFEPSKEYIE
ncbi:hypothetical protein C8Q72DRAFT_884089 [Fomitopsis betulina]|nr:hypothetical protein C8Q72DRAFT_884089 [Fomitopsis betulina]